VVSGANPFSPTCLHRQREDSPTWLRPSISRDRAWACEPQYLDQQ
jgi:hypothetical protein